MVNTAYLRTASGGAAGYLTFAAVITLIVELILFVVYLFDINASLNAPWTLIDTICTAVLLLIDFIAFCVSAAYGYIASYGAGAFFFIVLTIALAVELYFLCREQFSNGGFPTVTIGPKHGTGAGQNTQPAVDLTLFVTTTVISGRFGSNAFSVLPGHLTRFDAWNTFYT
ncbi:hypothetical protein SprV_0802575800 [Sparganum proliferum]